MQLHYSSALDGARASSLAESQLFEHLDITYDDLAFAVVLPEQFYDTVIPSAQQSGHIALRWAVLADALNCLIKASKRDGKREQRLAKETAEWVFTDEFDWPFSFVNICASLRIDPAYIRRGLLRWMQRGTSERLRRSTDQEVVVSLRPRVKRAEASSAHSTVVIRTQSSSASCTERSDCVALST
jgi:hypothetical protein